jgi:hypothetical protein
MNLSDSDPDQDYQTSTVPLWKASFGWTIENWRHLEGSVHQKFTFRDKGIVNVCFTRNDISLFDFVFQARSALFPSILWVRISIFTVDRTNTMYVQEKLEFTNGRRENSVSVPLQQRLIHSAYVKMTSFIFTSLFGHFHQNRTNHNRPFCLNLLIHQKPNPSPKTKSQNHNRQPFLELLINQQDRDLRDEGLDEDFEASSIGLTTRPSCFHLDVVFVVPFLYFTVGNLVWSLELHKPIRGELNRVQ